MEKKVGKYTVRPMDSMGDVFFFHHNVFLISKASTKGLAS